MSRSVPWRQTSAGLLIEVRASAGASRDAIEGVDVDASGAPYLKVRVRAAAEGGKANAAICALLAKALGVPKTAASVRRGHTARRKDIEIGGATAEAAATALLGETDVRRPD